MAQSRSQVRRHSVGLLLMLGVLVAAVTGCGGGEGGGSTTDGFSFPKNLPNYRTPDEWATLLEQAGLSDYADLGRRLYAAGKVSVVSPPTLDPSFNAFSWIPQERIWINAPLFSRYPRATDQAEIFLHELIHIKSGEASHLGPWWSALDQFRQYWSQP